MKRWWIPALASVIALMLTPIAWFGNPYTLLGWLRLGAPISSAGSVMQDGCRVLDSIPVVIFRSGTYCLADSVSSEETAIVVAADFVTIDLKGHAITGPTQPYDRKLRSFLGLDVPNVGIIGLGPSHVRILNGRIKGYDTAVVLDSWYFGRQGGSNSIINLDIVDSMQRGIFIRGIDNRVLDNKLSRIGGGVVPASIHTHGILSSGHGALINNNVIKEVRGSDFDAGSEGIAIAASGEIQGTIISNNRISNVDLISSRSKWAGSSPSTYAIWFGGDGYGNAAAFGNVIKNYINGIIADDHASVVIASNVALNTAIPFSGRDRRSQFRRADPSGYPGYIPSKGTGRRPIGSFLIGGNECHHEDKDSIVLSGLVEGDDCIKARDLAITPLREYLRQTESNQDHLLN